MRRAPHSLAMDDARLGRLIRVVRQRRGWRQTDLAAKASVGKTLIAEIESGRLEGIGLARMRKVVGAFGLSLELTIRGLGADVDRLLDERHASLLGACAAWLKSLGWLTVAEVSYSEWGERGSIDLLAWHAPTATLLVIEIKTELVSVEATLRKHDEKVRLAPTIARRLGWYPTSVARLLVLPDLRTEHRRVAGLRRHPARHRWRARVRGPVQRAVPERREGGLRRDDAVSGLRVREPERHGRLRLRDEFFGLDDTDRDR